MKCLGKQGVQRGNFILRCFETFAMTSDLPMIVLIVSFNCQV